MARQWYQLISSRDIDDEIILESDQPKKALGHTRPTVVILNATFPWWLSPCKKIKDINWFFPVLLLIKESFNLIWCEKQHNTINQKVWVSGATFP